MKSKLLLLSISTLLLSGCISPNPSVSGSTYVPIDNSNEDISSGDTSGSEPLGQNFLTDKPILHCFNWSLDNIKNNLLSIYESGYKAIQVSPLQPQKDPYDGYWSSQWWKLYQPYGFRIASGYSENKLGGKEQLKALCTVAKEYDIDIIVDVVANHLAGDNNKTFSPRVKDFESEIYNNDLQHKKGQPADYENMSQEEIIRYSLGNYPDLKTETTTIQNRVLSLLKEYIDCGVRGFRFDAAKHIETPSDGVYASNFWPNVLNGATSYALNKGAKSPYYYGELLYPVGPSRSPKYYTEYMSITDSNYSTKTLNAVINKKLNQLVPSYYDDPAKSLLWAESHDTYSNDKHETTYVDMQDIEKAYVIETSRKDVSTLFLSRPQGNLGSVGLSYNTNHVKAINKFHNICSKLNEHISVDQGVFINQRGKYGVVIVNLEHKGSMTYNLDYLEDGEYINLMSNSKVYITGHKANISLSNDGYAILVNRDYDGEEQGDLPSIKVNDYADVFAGEQTINFDIKNATTVYYAIDNGSKYPMENNQIRLEASLQKGHHTIKVDASNTNGTETIVLNLVKTSTLINKSLIIYDIDTNYSNLIWAWIGDGEGKWYEPTIEGSVIGLDMGSNTDFIVVKFIKGTTIATANWSNKVKQTSNIHFDQRVYDNSSFDYQ